MFEDMIAGLAALVAVYCAIRAALSWPADVLASLVPVAVVVVLVAAGIPLLIVLGGRKVRTHRFRIDPGGAPGKAIDHEVAHADKGDQLGGRTVKGRVYPDGSGYVDVRMPAGCPIEHEIAVDMAGARGEGENFWTSPHTRGDRANAAARVAHLPADERDRVYREAERLSYRRWWESGSAARLRRSLETTGQYR